jgi:hypothetical protein
MNPLKKSALFTTMLFVALLRAHSSQAETSKARSAWPSWSPLNQAYEAE